jgi:hypothetical protein
LSEDDLRSILEEEMANGATTEEDSEGEEGRLGMTALEEDEGEEDDGLLMREMREKRE